MYPRIVLHVDLDYFYAQCEENLNPTIRGRPVVVCVYSGRTAESGVVSTSNYEARRSGVKAGIPITRAKKILEKTDAVFIPMNRPHYEQVSDRIMGILEPFADAFEKAGIDEAYLDSTSKTSGDFSNAEQIARKIKQSVLEQEQITCTIGIAPNKLLAKIASDRNKPNGLTIVKPEDVAAFLAQLEVNKIPGVGIKTEKKLHQLSLRTISEVAALDASVLRESFGSGLGDYLYHAVRGKDDEPVERKEQPTQISRIATLKRDTHEISEISLLLLELTNSATVKLTEKGMTCKTVSTIAILGDLSIHSRSRTLDIATDDVKVITQASKELVEQFLNSTSNSAVRRIGVRLSGLSTKSGQTIISKFL